MLRFVVAGMAVVILGLAGVTGFLAYDRFTEDDDGGSAPSRPMEERPTAWDAVSYKDRHDMCHDFATASTPSHGSYATAYSACMQCGPDKVSLSAALGWHCP